MTAVQDQPNAVAEQTRNGMGRFDRSPDTAERDADMARLRSRSWTYQQIADHYGITKASAYQAVQRVLRETIQEPAEELRQLELQRLDGMAQVVLKVLEKYHVVVSNGKVVYLDGEPLEDDAPVLAAVDRLLKIQERRAKLLGLDVPVKQEIAVDLGVEYRIIGVDVGQLR